MRRAAQQMTWRDDCSSSQMSFSFRYGIKILDELLVISICFLLLSPFRFCSSFLSSGRRRRLGCRIRLREARIQNSCVCSLCLCALLRRADWQWRFSVVNCAIDAAAQAERKNEYCAAAVDSHLHISLILTLTMSRVHRADAISLYFHPVYPTHLTSSRQLVI